ALFAGGWIFEPHAILYDNWLGRAKAGAYGGTDCQAVERFTYVAAGQGLRFQRRELEEPCAYRDTAGGLSATQCGSSSRPPDACRKPDFWSAESQVALDLSDRDQPVLRFADGRIEVMKRGVRESAAPFSASPPADVWVTSRWIDRNGNATRYDYDR